MFISDFEKDKTEIRDLNLTQKKQKPSAYSSSLQVVVSLLKNKKFGEAIAILEELEKKGEMKNVHHQIYHFPYVQHHQHECQCED